MAASTPDIIAFFQPIHPSFPWQVIDATQMANLKQLPESLAVIGGGVISVEYATVCSAMQCNVQSSAVSLQSASNSTPSSSLPSLPPSFLPSWVLQVFASLGVPTALLCREEAFLPFLPEELRAAIKAEMARDGIQVVHSDVATFKVDEGGAKMVRFAFEDGSALAVDLCLYSGGRDANSEKIGCENVGVGIGKYGRVLVDKDFRTANPRIFAIGDVVGPPGLASFAQQAGRIVTDNLFRTEEEEEEEAAERKKEKEKEKEANKYAGASY